MLHQIQVQSRKKENDLEFIIISGTPYQEILSSVQRKLLGRGFTDYFEIA